MIHPTLFQLIIRPFSFCNYKMQRKRSNRAILCLVDIDSIVYFDGNTKCSGSFSLSENCNISKCQWPAFDVESVLTHTILGLFMRTHEHLADESFAVDSPHNSAL